MQTLLNEIKDICLKYELASLQKLIVSAENLFAKKFIDIAVFGQFKAGKSSFINSFIGRQILPTAVIPATSVITKIYYGEKERVFVTFLDGHSEEISLVEIENYVTESKNPDNIKAVETAHIEIPEFIKYKGLCFVDTPGIGSIFLKNTQTTKEWSAEATIAVICISAERPLSEHDLKLIKELDAFSYKQICLLTKTDLFTNDQLKEITAFLQTSFQREIGKNMDIYSYSVFKNTEYLKNAFYENICKPLVEKYDKEIEKIIRHKVVALTSNCINYIDIAYQASLKTDNEKEHLKKRIFDEKVNIKFIQHELQLMATDSKSRIREKVYNIFEPHSGILINELQCDFYKEFPLWKGNLYRLTGKFEEWLKTSLKDRLKKIAEEEKAQFDKIVDEVNAHFGFYATSLRERLNENIQTVLGIKLPIEEWNPEFKTLKQPDISIYRVFDSHIEILWFLFPMFFFRKIFRKHFYKQVSFEVEKNIYRITSDISEIINKLAEFSKEETLKYIQIEINTIENALSGEQSKSSEYEKTLVVLKQKIKDLTI